MKQYEPDFVFTVMPIARRSLLAFAAAPFAFPQSGPGLPLLHAWLAAYNSNDRPTLLAFYEKHAADAPTRADRSLRTRQDTGAFELVRTLDSTPTQITAILHQKGGDLYAKVTMNFSGADSPQIQSVLLHPAPDPADADAKRVTLPEALAALDERATSRAAADRFSGVILVADKGRTVFEKAYGLADRERNLPNTPATRFRIGSMNKMFTAIAILQLIEKGKLALTDPIAKYLPNYPNKDFAAKVTVRHLLTHTAGAGDIFTKEYETHRLQTRTLNDYVKLYGARPVEFEPGSKWQYANYGFLLLGVLIETITGKSYYDAVDQSIFQPAGMKHTGSEPESQPVPNRSAGYMRANDAWKPNTDTLPWRGTSAGGGYSTAADLARFAHALESGKLLGKSLLHEATTKQAGDRMPYGYGFVPHSSPLANYGHSGGAPGMNGELRIYTSTNRVFVSLTNLDPPAASLMAEFFQTRMPLA